MELVPSSMYEHSRGTCHKDEMFMQQSLEFSDSLKELKSLRKQLYSAAEYFESSDTTDDHKHIMMETLKDYAIKALVNTVDHLGSIASKVDNLMDKKMDEFGRSELQFSCIEQRIRTWNEFNDRQRLSQQSLVIETPKYHQRYILPEVRIMDGQKATQYYRDDLHQPGTGMLFLLQCCFIFLIQICVFHDCLLSILKGLVLLCSVCGCSAEVILPKTRGTTSSSVRKLNLASPHSLPYMTPKAFSFVTFASTNILDKQRVHVQQAQLMHSRSFISRLPFQNSLAAKKRYPSPPGKSNSLVVYNAKEEKKKKKELEEYSSKTKRLFNALLSMRK